MTVRYGQRGYSGASRSNRAVQAEQDGRLPLSRAVKEVARFAGCTQKVARAALEATWDGEWHHTSKYANATNYYSVQAATAYLELQPILERLPEDWEARINLAIVGATKGLGYGDESSQARFAAIEQAERELAELAGCTMEEIDTLYYETWE